MNENCEDCRRMKKALIELTRLIERLDEAMASEARIRADTEAVGGFVSGLHLVETEEQIVERAIKIILHKETHPSVAAVQVEAAEESLQNTCKFVRETLSGKDINPYRSPAHTQVAINKILAALPKDDKMKTSEPTTKTLTREEVVRQEEEARERMGRAARWTSEELLTLINERDAAVEDLHRVEDDRARLQDAVGESLARAERAEAELKECAAELVVRTDDRNYQTERAERAEADLETQRKLVAVWRMTAETGLGPLGVKVVREALEELKGVVVVHHYERMLFANADLLDEAARLADRALAALPKEGE